MLFRARWPHSRASEWGRPKRNFFIARSSSASASDLTAEDEASGKADNGAGGGVIQAATEDRQSVFLGNALGRLEEAINSLPPVFSAVGFNFHQTIEAINYWFKLLPPRA